MVSFLSANEKQYQIDGIKDNVREDARERFDYRAFQVQTGIIPSANGSAEVRLMPHTRVIVGIKGELGEPKADKPKEGYLEFNVDCSASSQLDEVNISEMNALLSNTLTNLICSTDSVDLSCLCIKEGKKCWVLYVDCLVLDSSGNVFDAVSIAARAALYDCKIPNLVWTDLEDDDYLIRVSEDPDDCMRLDVVNVPISVTLAKFGTAVIVDPSLNEEECMDARLTIGVNQIGNICCIQKGGTKSGFTPMELQKLIQIARKIGVTTLGTLTNILKSSDNR